MASVCLHALYNLTSPSPFPSSFSLLLQWEHRAEYSAFITPGDEEQGMDGIVPLPGQDYFRLYCQKKAQAGAFAGHAELRAFSQLSGKKLLIFAGTQSCPRLYAQQAEEGIEYTESQTLRFWYKNGNHYDSIVEPEVATNLHQHNAEARVSSRCTRQDYYTNHTNTCSTRT